MAGCASRKSCNHRWSADYKELEPLKSCFIGIFLNKWQCDFYNKKVISQLPTNHFIFYYYCPIKINSIGVIYHRQGCKPLMRKIIYIISAVGATEN